MTDFNSHTCMIAYAGSTSRRESCVSQWSQTGDRPVRACPPTCGLGENTGRSPSKVPRFQGGHIFQSLVGYSTQYFKVAWNLRETLILKVIAEFTCVSMVHMRVSKRYKLISVSTFREMHRLAAQLSVRCGCSSAHLAVVLS